MKHTRRSFLKMTGAGVSAALLGAGISCSRQRKPNIIYILADDLGYGDLGCYGQKDIRTPHLDRMAAEGMRFTQHYAGSTVCAPSRCCLMTGYHTGHATIRGNGRIPLTDRDKTVPEYLKEAGYTTGLIGKWGLGEEGSSGIPNKKGFDYFFGYLNQRRAHNYYPEFLWRNTEKVFLDNEQKFTKDGVGSAAVKRVQYSHDLFADEALSFVEKNRENPFFLYLALTIPHANNESWLVNRHGMEVPDYGEYKDKDWPEAQKGTAAMISCMDRDIGRIVEQLKKLGIDDDTIIMFSSDNGPHREGQNDPDFFDSNGAYRGIKRDLYEGGIRVPFVVRWPGKIEAGQVSHHISAFWDLLPTACELAGLETSEQPDGISFLPTLLGKTQTEHPYLYWEFFEQGGKQAVRAGKWKAVRLKVNQNPSGPLELYDLEQDPGEERNIAAEYPDVAYDMAALLNKARTPSKHFQFAFEKKENVDQK